MELTAKELEAFKGIQTRRTALKVMGWSLLCVGVVFFLNDAKGEWFARSQVSLSVVFLLSSFCLLHALYFQISSNDRLLELLTRYANSDAQALEQMTEAKASGRAT